MHHMITNRGEHAHLDTDQVVIAASGSFKLHLSDGTKWETYEMNDPTRGLYVPRMIFIKIRDLSKNATCLVLASTHYDIKRSVRSWNEYLKFVKNKS